MCNNGIYDHFEAHEKNCFGVVFDTMWKKKTPPKSFILGILFRFWISVKSRIGII